MLSTAIRWQCFVIAYWHESKPEPKPRAFATSQPMLTVVSVLALNTATLNFVQRKFDRIGTIHRTEQKPTFCRKFAGFGATRLM